MKSLQLSSVLITMQSILGAAASLQDSPGDCRNMGMSKDLCSAIIAAALPGTHFLRGNVPVYTLNGGSQPTIWGSLA